MERTLIETMAIDNEHSVVIYRLARPTFPHKNYATWVAHNTTPDDTFWGHYDLTLEQAIADAHERGAK